MKRPMEGKAGRKGGLGLIKLNNSSSSQFCLEELLRSIFQNLSARMMQGKPLTGRGGWVKAVGVIHQMLICQKRKWGCQGHYFHFLDTYSNMEQLSPNRTRQ